MIAKTINGKTTAEIYASFEASISDGYQPTLAIIFVSISQDREAIIEIFEKNNIAIFGATSSGEFINGHQSEGAIVIMLLDLDRTYFSILFENIGNRTLANAAVSLTQHALQKFSNPAFILCSTMAGFYTYGEFGKAINGKYDFHSTTNSWVALKEKTTTP